MIWSRVTKVSRHDQDFGSCLLMYKIIGLEGQSWSTLKNVYQVEKDKSASSSLVPHFSLHF